MSVGRSASVLALWRDKGRGAEEEGCLILHGCVIPLRLKQAFAASCFLKEGS